MQQTKDLEIFVKASESGTVSGVARVMNVPKATVSRALARIEGELGVRLFERTSRLLKLTEIGVTFKQRCERILSEIEQAEFEAESYKSEPRGTLRIGCTNDISRDLLSVSIPEFLERHPNIDVRVRAGERQVPEANIIDVVLHAGWMLDSRFIARKLCDVEIILVASRSYVERMGTPRTVDDLKDHRVVGNIYLDEMAPDPGRLPAYVPVLDLDVSGHPERVPIWRHFASTDLMLTLDVVRAGVAIAATVAPRVHHELRTGEIVRILPDHPIRDQPALYALGLDRAAINPKVDVFLRFLLEKPPYQRLVEAGHRRG